MRDANRLHRLLTAAGIPVIGVLVGDQVTVQYGPDATPEQLAQGAQIEASLDWDADPQAAYQAALSAGYAVEPEGFTLRLGDSDRLLFSQLSGFLREGLDLGALTAETGIPIADADGVLRLVSVGRLRQILFAYGVHYQTLWTQLVAAGG